MPANHDLGYKYLFAHPELVRQLITDYTSFTWLDGISESAFERVNPAYVSDQLTEREDDIVWRVKLGEQWLYIYILLEFQSGVDHWMALRMQAYVGLLYQDLVKRHEFSPGKQLPPVLPLVFYNGRAPWTASTSMDGMILEPPKGLAAFQPAQRYFLIDQHRLDLSGQARRASLLGLLFRVELLGIPDVIRKVLPVLDAWLNSAEQAPLKHAVQTWVDQQLLHEFDGMPIIRVGVPEKENEMYRKFDTWAEEVRDEGRQQGIQQGIEQGRQEGLAILRRALKVVLDNPGGALPGAVAERIDHASIDTVEQWLERAIHGASVSMLFTEDTRR